MSEHAIPAETAREQAEEESVDRICPAGSGSVRQEKCKMVCRSAKCVYRVVFNCSES